MSQDALPAEGYVRLKTILGDKKATPPTPAVIPISYAAWWDGIKTGKYPPAVKLGKRTSVWRVSDIRQLIETGAWTPEEVVTSTDAA